MPPLRRAAKIASPPGSRASARKSPPREIARLEPTLASHRVAPAPRRRDIRVLGTDLDGTFLAGSDRARNALIAHFRDHPERRLLYVTGRSAASVRALIADGLLPQPDAMICDVGAFVVTDDAPDVAAELLAEIHAAWGDSGAQARAALAGLAGLRLQEDFGPYRVSYYCNDPAIAAEAAARLADLDCDVLASGGCYLDVLPRGINKGTTLRRLVAEWGAPGEAVLAAGDSANDLSMFHAGVCAVAVGNSDADLLAQMPAGDHLLRADGPGCDGILEALDAFGVELPRV